MASPLTTLRKYQFAFFVVFGVLLMVVFVVGDPLYNWLGGASRSADEDATVVTWRNGSLTESDIAYERGIRNVVGEFINALLQETTNRKGVPQVQQPSLSPSERDIIYTRILASKAEQMGLVVTRETVLQYLDRLTANLISRPEIGAIFDRTAGNRISEMQMLNVLQYELAAQNYIMIGLADITRGPLPGEAWEYYQRLHRRVKAEVLPLSVAAFKDQVKKQPTDAEIQALYDKGKDLYPDPALPEPGFKRLRKAAFEYVRVDRKKLEDEEAAKLRADVTDQEITDYYDKNRDEFRVTQLPVDPANPAEQPESKPKGTDQKEDMPPEKPSATPPATPENKKADSEKPADQPAEGKPAPDKPEEKPAPEKPAETPAPENKPAEDKPAANDKKSDDDKKPEAEKENTPESTPPADKDSDKKESDEKDSGENSGACQDEEPAQQEDKKKDDADKPADPPAAEPKPDAEKKSDSESPQDKPAEDKKGDTKKEDAQPADEAKPDSKPATDESAKKPETPADPAAAPAKDATPPAADGTSADPAKPSASEAPSQPEPQYRPLDDKLKEEIRDKVAQQKASRIVQERVEKAFTKVRQAVEKYARTVRSAQFNKKKTAPAELDVNKLAAEVGLEAGSVPLSNPLEVTEHELGKAVGFDFSSMRFDRVGFDVLAYRDGIPLYKPEEIHGENFNVQFLYWKTKEEEPFVPELKDIRDEVVDAWKQQQALTLAREEAKALAEKARKAPSLKEAFADDSEKKVTETNEFTWMTTGFVPAGMGMPALSSVDGVEMAGEEFMKAVFSLDTGEVGVAVNQPHTTVYVVRIMSESPSEDTLREMFLLTGASPEVQQVAMMDRRDSNRSWFETLEREMNVKWNREPQS